MLPAFAALLVLKKLSTHFNTEIKAILNPKPRWEGAVSLPALPAPAPQSLLSGSEQAPPPEGAGPPKAAPPPKGAVSPPGAALPRLLLWAGPREPGGAAEPTGRRWLPGPSSQRQRKGL